MNKPDSDHLEKRLLALEQENAALRIEQKNHARLKDIYKCLRLVNRLVVVENDKNILIRKTCEYLIKYHSYKNAWIVIFDDDGGVEAAACDGFGPQAESMYDELVSGNISSCIPGGKKTGEVIIIKEPEEYFTGCPLSGIYSENSAMSVRLGYGERCYGILTVAAPAEYFENKDEIGIFSDLSGNLSLALHNLATGEQARRLSYIVQTLPQIFSFLSTDYRYLAVNDIYSELYGMPINSFIGLHLSDFFSEDQFEHEIKPRLDMCLTGTPQDYDIEMNFKTLGRRWIHVYYFPYYDETGTVVGISSHGVDVTQRKVAEREQKLSEMRYRYLVETVPDIITRISAAGILIEVNEYTCRLLGRAREEIVGHPVTVMDPNYNPANFKVFWDDVPLWENRIFESSYMKKTGESFPVEISGKKVKLDNRIYIISIARDISIRKERQEKLLEAVKRAEEADRLKSSFLANMSHEIRTPLNGILGFSSLMSEPGITEEKQREYYSIIEQSGKRLLTTINDLIDISRIETGTVEAIVSEVDIDLLLTALYDFFKPEFDEKNIEFELVMYNPEPPLVINTDHDKLDAIMINLLKNAAKFTASGRVGFGYSLNGETVEFFTEDTGVGISPVKLNKIFDRFIQADQSLTKPYEGSGLGLSISREYAGMLGGNLIAESEEGRGARFSFSIPAEISEDRT